MKEKLRKISKYTSRLLIVSFFLPFVTLCSISEQKRAANSIQAADSIFIEEVQPDALKEKTFVSTLGDVLFPKDSATGFDIALFNIPKKLDFTLNDLLGMLFPFTFLLICILAVISFLKKQNDLRNFLLILPVFLFYAYIMLEIVPSDVLYGFWIASSLIFITFVLNSIVYFYKRGEEL